MKMNYNNYINMARNHVVEKNFIDAEQYFKLAHSLNKDSSIAAAGAGHCCAQQGKTEEAIKYLNTAGKIVTKYCKRDNNINPLLDISQELFSINALYDAQVWIDKSLAIRKNSARAYHLKASILSRINQPELALDFAKKATSLDPKSKNAAILLASLYIEIKKPQDAEYILRQVLSDNPENPRALFELGRSLDRLGEFHEAFEVLTKSGLINSQSTQYREFDLAGIYTELDKNKAFFNQEWLEKKTAKYPEKDTENEKSPVFIIGFYRSGTTLLEQILDAHPDVVCSNESPLIPAVIKELYRMTAATQGEHWIKLLEKAGNAGRQQLKNYYWEIAERHIQCNLDNKILIDKTTMNTINIAFIKALFPECKIIFCMRDPRDVLLSCFMQAFSPNPLTAHFLNWDEGARFYAAVMNYWIDTQKITGLNFHELRYENLTRDMHKTLQPLMKYLGLEWHKNMDEYYSFATKKIINTPSYSDVTKPVYRSSAGRWLNYAERFKHIEQIISPFLTKFDYI